MQLSNLFFAFALIPFSSALQPHHQQRSKTALNNCQNVDRLDSTMQRVSPMLEKIVQLHGHGGNKNSSTVTRTVHGRRHSHAGVKKAHEARDLGDLFGQVDAVKSLLGKSTEKLNAKKMSCQAPVTPSASASPLVSGKGKGLNIAIRDDDDDDDDEEEDDDEQCSLEDVLDELMETVECLLSFSTGLLEGVLDTVFSLLKGVVHMVGGMMDLD